MWATRKAGGPGGAVAAAAAVAAVVTMAGSAAGSAGPAQLRLALPPGPRVTGPVIGTLPPTRRLHLTVVLKPAHPAALAAVARAVSDPSSPQYRDYLTPRQVGERFGATAGQVQAVRAYLRGRGLSPGPVSVNRLSIPVTATAGRIEHAFRLTLQRRALARGRVATVASAAPALAPQIARDVQVVLGLSSVSAPHPQLLHAALRPAVRPRLGPHVVTGGPQPCSQASAAASQQSAYTADQIASAYGLSGLYSAGDEGQGVTIAEYELEAYDPADIAQYQACYGTHASITDVPVDGGATTAAPGSGEAALDIENAIGLAPRAKYLVYEGPNAAQAVPGSGPYETFSAIINQNRANVISVSWGECEQLEGSTGAQAESTLFEQAAAQGQTVISASGDQGSEDCTGPSGPNPQLAVDDPASQPFVTGVGGTSTSQIGPPPSQSVWNNGGNVTGLLGLQPGAGGGGISALWAMQGYQSNAAGSLHVVNGQSSGSNCNASSGDCREVPDVSANADPNTGYVIYYNGSRSNATAPSGWQGVGGTSAGAPVWAAVMALIDASSACHGSPVGFANPALYRAAGSAYSSYFHDVTSGNNDFTGTNGGLYGAGPGYDMASGLGTPNASALAGPLCADTLRLVDPGTRTASVGQSVRLQLKTTGPLAGSATYVSNGLPPGLVLGRFSGKITGKPTKAGTFNVGVAVLDSNLSIRGAAFRWRVEHKPTVSSASLGGVAAGRPVLRMSVRAGQGAPGLTELTLSPPAGLRFAAARVRVRGQAGARIRFHSQLRGGHLTIFLVGAPRLVTLTDSFPALASNAALSSRTRRQHSEALSLTLATTDAAGHRVTQGVRIRAH